MGWQNQSRVGFQVASPHFKSTQSKNRPIPEAQRKFDAPPGNITARGVSGIFSQAINDVILGFLFSSILLSIANKVKLIASDWFGSEGSHGINFIKEVHEPYRDVEYYDKDHPEEGPYDPEDDDAEGMFDDDLDGFDFPENEYNDEPQAVDEQAAPMTEGNPLAGTPPDAQTVPEIGVLPEPGNSRQSP
ncbi:uncharacterized protein LOC100898191 [Galendromus occidentalis]|uniref:Uncharacterized protein LOC100898191 n=1 Tax=Galendromus occidentalis TaxID=34638 RepID=A0AAJ6QYT4_9ACAR|nr:uncharacterized protein LOC100898191 [Galendromus occidentalis]